MSSDSDTVSVKRILQDGWRRRPVPVLSEPAADEKGDESVNDLDPKARSEMFVSTQCRGSTDEAKGLGRDKTRCGEVRLAPDDAGGEERLGAAWAPGTRCQVTHLLHTNTTLSLIHI